MNARTTITLVVAAFTAFFVFLTVYAAIDQGITFGTFASLVVIVLFVIALLGLLSQPPDG